MKKFAFIAVAVTALSFAQPAKAQWESIRQEGEIGFTLGAAHYFGDLNTRAALNRPKLAFGAFFRKQFGNYIGLRVAAHFAQLGYSDIYNTHNEYQRRRNLSFNSNIFELALQGDFNFFKFVPGDPDHSFTPYITFGAGIFSYDPYAYLGGQKYFLRTLATEGQGTAAYPDRKPYNTMAVSIPFGVGIKYAINDRMNVGFEVAHRFTNTDYLDDVSKTFVGADKFPPLPDGSPSIAQLLQDRSYETGDIIGIEGRQRGLPKQNDQFVFAELTFSFNLTSYRCPTAK
ncbi:MAG: outer membrane beta-barrel protein [Chitinophagaceae bacterium]|nr:outer membrane beta-barrel protein [Chitinophagaceae bacterium]